MQSTYFSVLLVAVFVMQFILCVKKPKLVFRLIPTMLLLAGLAVCGIVYAVDPASSGVSYAAAVIGVVIGVLLVIDGAAWAAATLIANKK